MYTASQNKSGVSVFMIIENKAVDNTLWRDSGGAISDTP
jgi:hypothetical protein